MTARADFLGEQKPNYYRKLKIAYSLNELDHLWEHRQRNEVYQKHLKKLEGNEYYQRIRSSLHEQPRAIGLIPRMTLEELRKIRENAILILLENKKKREHIKARKVLDGIYREWERRCEISRQSDGYFRWPTTSAPGGDGTLSGAAFPDQGMLSYMGYRVGETQGVDRRVRQYILDEVFRGSLPPVNSLAYVLEWAHPGTPKRLEKIANTIASLARNAKRRKNNPMDVAIAEWEQDLEYLYQNYYIRRFSFGWPSTRLDDTNHI